MCDFYNIKDRDIHAANSMMAIYLNYKDASGTGGTSKPVKKISFKAGRCNIFSFASVHSSYED